MLVFSDCNETSIFMTDFRKNAYVINFMKIFPVRNETFHEDGRTDGQSDMVRKPAVAFLSFANEPNKLEEHRQYNAWANTISSVWFIDIIQGNF